MVMPRPRNHPLEEDSFPGGPFHAGSGLGVPSDPKTQDRIGSQGKSYRKTDKLARNLGETLSWIFRTNLPPRRGLPLESVQEREWFGFGQRLNVIVNPSDTLIQLTETRRELQKTQRDLRLRTSPSSCYIPPRAFSLPLIEPGPSQPFLSRTLECSTLQRICSGPPTFTVLCGAPAIGKTTLLREALRNDQIYATIYLDLKVLGADGVGGLLVSLAAALEGFLEELQMTGTGGVGGEEDMDHLEKLLRAIKHERRILFHRLLDYSQPQAEETSTGPVVTSNDVARLLQLFRTSLSLYWSTTRHQVHHTCTPSTSSCIHDRNARTSESTHSKSNSRGDTGLVNSVGRTDSKNSKPGWISRSQIFQFGASHTLQVSHGGATNDSEEETKVEHGTGNGSGGNSGALPSDIEIAAPTGLAREENQPEQVEEKKEDIDRQETTPAREEKARVDRVVETNDDCGKRADNDGEPSYCIRMPLIVFDDAQRLLSLARSGTPRSKQKTQVLRTLIDGLLVLSKQDRLCHVIHATNNGLYVNWLREMYIDGYKVVTLTEPSKSQIRTYFKQGILSSIPSSLHKQLKIEAEDEKEVMFGRLYDTFGGRLSHWTDFIGDWVNAGGDLPVERSTPFLHAYTSLNILLLRSCESEDEVEARLELGEDHETLNERNLRDRRDGVRSRARIRKRSRSRSPSQTRADLGRQARLPGKRHGGMKSSTTLVGAGVNFEDPTCDTNDIENGEKPPLATMQFLDLVYRLITPLSYPRPTRDPSRYFSRTSTLFMQSPKMRLVRPLSTRSGKGISAFVPARKDDDEDFRGANGRGMKCLPIPYFALCREMGSGGREAVDFLVRSKILEVRWGSCLGDREGENEIGKEMDPCMYGPTVHPSSPVVAHVMRLVLEEYGYQPGIDSVIDLNPEHEHDQEVGLELEPVRPIHRFRRHDNIHDNTLPREVQDENERDEFVDGEGYEEPPTAVGSSAGRYYGGGGRVGHGHGHGYASGRESSGLSDDKSDYMSFVEDVSEY